MPLNPAAVAATGEDLLACACAALVAAGLMETTCCDPEGNGFRSFLSASGASIPIETCGCSCGVLAVRLVRLFESEILPGQIIGPSRCGHRQAVAEFEVQRHTCVSDEGDVVRPPATLTGNATKLWTDLWVLWTGIECCFRTWETEPTEIRQGWMVDATPIDPLGACGGASITVQISVGPSCDCRPSTPEPIP